MREAQVQRRDHLILAKGDLRLDWIVSSRYYTAIGYQIWDIAGEGSST